MPLPKISDTLAVHISRLGPMGLCPKAPGTAGSALAAVLAPLIFMPWPIWLRILLLVVIFCWGSLIISQAETSLGQHDPGEIVLDELVGQWVTFLPFASLSIVWLAVGFVLFRIFDIAKPYPVGASEKWLEGGWGVMIDDVFAGFYAMACLGILRLFFA